MQKHKILAFLLALIVSIGLWVYAVTVVNPDDTKTISDVRVRITDLNTLTSKGLMLTGGEDQTVTIEVAGRRSDLKELSSSSLEAVASVKYIDHEGESWISWELGFPKTVASGDIRVVSISSDRIKITVSEYRERNDIPVEVQYEGELPENYLRDAAILDPETISVKGPKDEVGNIAKAILTVNVDGAKDLIDQEMEYVLVDENGEKLALSEYVTIDEPTIHVSVPIHHYKDIELKVNINESNGAKETDVDVSVDPKTIRVIGSEEALEALGDMLYITEVDLAEITDGWSSTFVPELPSGVTNRASDKDVTVTIQFKKTIKTKTITFQCDKITLLNSTGSVEILEQTISIVIRGKSAAVNAISAENIQVNADLSSYVPQEGTVKLEIVLPENAEVDLLGGPYVVNVKIN